MEYISPEFSRSDVNRAGRTLCSTKVPEEEFVHAAYVCENWRASYSYPLYTIKMDLRQKALAVASQAVVAQRLKRRQSILGKLKRFDGMNLARMHDIGGCRAVLPELHHVQSLRARYERTRAEHELKRTYDYISHPKEDGYRGIHLVYQFCSRNRSEYNKHLVEIQIRSALQHAWATAVETVDLITDQDLKSGAGEADWETFFRLSSAAFAIRENSPQPAGTPKGVADLALALKSAFEALDVQSRLDGYSRALKHAEPQVGKYDYFIIAFDPLKSSVSVHSFTEARLDRALREFRDQEPSLPFRETGRDPGQRQVVLVGADSISQLRSSYPNYFLDTRIFLEAVNSFLEETLG